MIYNPDPWDDKPDSEEKLKKIKERELRLERKDARNQLIMAASEDLP